MELFVYRLRFKGNRISRASLGGVTAMGAVGDLRYFRAPFSYFGKETWLAELLCPANKPLIPGLTHARMLKVESGLLIAGLERTYSSTKDHGTDHRQSWYCTVARVPNDVFARYAGDEDIPF
jgi:hypothetical protein